MSGFDDRQKSFEAKFHHDQELLFKIKATRNKRLGLWAAEKLGHADPDAYALEVIKSDFEEVGDEDVVRKVHGDLEAKGLGVSMDDVRERLHEIQNEVAEALAKS